MVLVTILLSVGLASCSSDDDSQTGDVRLADTVKTEQVIYADETSNGDITFTANAAWTATVRDANTGRSVGGSSVEWLTLNQYSGDAGTFTLAMTLMENLTGSDRKAEIIIQCGSTTITIVVVQKTTRQDGTTMKRIKEISCEETINSNLYGGGDGVSEDNFVRTFAYDEQGRVTRIVTTYPNHSDSWELSLVTATYDYSIVGEIAIRIAEVYSYSGSEEEVSEYRAILNEQGNVVVLQEKENGIYTDYIQFSYTADGYLAQVKDCDEYEQGEEKFSYTDGYFTKYTYKSRSDSTTVFDYSDSYAHSYKNNGQLDFMAYLYEDDDFDFLLHIGRLGRLGKYMPERLYFDYADAAYPLTNYTEPNVTIHEVHSYVSYISPYASVSYAFDSNDNLTTIKTVEPFTATTIEYDVVVGSELEYPDEPISYYNGYKYTIENRTESKKDDTNTRVFTIKY